MSDLLSVSEARAEGEKHLSYLKSLATSGYYEEGPKTDELHLLMREAAARVTYLLDLEARKNQLSLPEGLVVAQIGWVGGSLRRDVTHPRPGQYVVVPEETYFMSGGKVAIHSFSDRGMVVYTNRGDPIQRGRGERWFVPYLTHEGKTTGWGECVEEAIDNHGGGWTGTDNQFIVPDRFRGGDS